MNLDDAIGIVAREARRQRRHARKRKSEGYDLAAGWYYRNARALSLVMWAAKEKADRERVEAQREKDSAELAAVFKEPYNQPRQVAPFMFECPGCLQHFGRGKGPYGLARHCCHPSHPRMRRAR